MTLPDGQITHVPLMPITLGNIRPSLRLSPPRLGEHTDALLAEAGYTGGQILAMHEARIAKTD